MPVARDRKPGMICGVDLYGQPVAREYADFATHWVGDESPVFHDWALGVAGDPDVLALLESLPEVKRQPNLVFAAARWHGAEPGPYSGLRSVLLDRWEAVRDTVMARSTQTNEVARCATLLPALAGLEGPLALVEVGPSAGLCLLPDRYSYRWSDGSTLDPHDGPSRVVLHCDVGGAPPLPVRMPQVVWRAGIDLNPLDVHDDDQMAWLRTLVWPGQHERLDRLTAAIEVARADPPQLVSGDLLDGLPGLVEQAPAGATVVVQHSAVIAYLDPADRRRFDAMMRDLVAARRCHWLSNEASVVLPSIAAGVEAPAQSFVLGVDGEPVALTHPHGRRLTWL